MAIHIQSGKRLNSSSKVKIQYMPFKISADCEANVSSFFKSAIKSTKDSNSSASFRGYPLVGKNIDVPYGYVGIILQENIKPDTEKEDRKFYRVQDFSSFVYWNWDKVPSQNDPILGALNEWIDVAEALHSPVTET